MKYPKAGDLQRETVAQLTGNPCGPKTNPWEVRSTSGLEGVFADPDDAEFYADEIRGAGAVGVTVTRRERTGRQQEHATNPAHDRLFAGVYPTGIVYADREREVDGDYLRVAFLPFSTLELEWEPGSHPAELREQIEDDAAEIIAKRGEQYPISSSGQMVTLGKENPPRVLREKYGDASEIVIESNRYGYTAWLESKRGGGRLPISFGATKPETAREAMELAKRFLSGVYGRSNPGDDTTVYRGFRIIKRGRDHYTIHGEGIPQLWVSSLDEAFVVIDEMGGSHHHENPAGLTAKGERMYEHIKASYGDDPRAAEIAARTVLARAEEDPSLKQNARSMMTGPGWQSAQHKLASAAAASKKNPPFVLPVPGQQIRSWDHGAGYLVKLCEESNDGSFVATIKLASGRTVAVPLTRTEYDLGPRKLLERRTGFSRHEQFIGAPQPERLPRGTPMEFEDTILEPETVLQTRISNPRKRRR